jgi:hypothetical protein
VSPNKDHEEKIESGEIIESKSKGDPLKSDEDAQKSDEDAQKPDEDPPQLTEEDLKHDKPFLKSLDYLTLILPVAFSQKHFHPPPEKDSPGPRLQHRRKHARFGFLSPQASTRQPPNRR